MAFHHGFRPSHAVLFAGAGVGIAGVADDSLRLAPFRFLGYFDRPATTSFWVNVQSGAQNTSEGE